jgi:hypothetical protein
VACAKAHPVKIAASVCANGVGFHENPTAAIRMPAVASHCMISGIARGRLPLRLSGVMPATSGAMR